MRAAIPGLILLVSVWSSACGEPASNLEAQASGTEAPRVAEPVELPPTAAQERARAEAALDQDRDAGQEASAMDSEGTEGTGDLDAGEADAGELGAPSPADAGEVGADAGAPADADPLAPELPKGPEPGSPEADAELAALLEESTLTQEEFENAFKNGGPKIEDDALMFGAGDRTRKRPKISVGKPKVTGSKLDGEALRALAKADLSQLEACHAMALTKDPGQLGVATLRLRYDGKGKVGGASVEQETAKLSEALCACLSSVAQGWTLAEAKGATVDLPLTLSTQ